MKKILLSLIGSVALVGIANAGIVTTVVQPGTFTNLLTSFPGSVYVKQIILSANTTNASALLYDTPTNSTTYTVAAYTNTVSYATNYITSWTNYYGVAQSYTNVSLIDVTNNVVAASTNGYPIRLSVATLANTTATYNSPTSTGYYFGQGIWATNNSSGIATITIAY